MTEKRCTESLQRPIRTGILIFSCYDFINTNVSISYELFFNSLNWSFSITKLLNLTFNGLIWPFPSCNLQTTLFWNRGLVELHLAKMWAFLNAQLVSVHFLSAVSLGLFWLRTQHLTLSFLGLIFIRSYQNWKCSCSYCCNYSVVPPCMTPMIWTCRNLTSYDLKPIEIIKNDSTQLCNWFHFGELERNLFPVLGDLEWLESKC